MMTPALADITFSNEALTVSVIGIIIMLCGVFASARTFIRTSAGVKETQTMEITGQPINFRQDKELVEMREHKEFKAAIKDQHDELWKVVNGIRMSVSKIESSVAGLTVLREANGDRLSELSHQVVELAKSVHTLTGVVQTKLKAVH